MVEMEGGGWQSKSEGRGLRGFGSGGEAAIGGAGDLWEAHGSSLSVCRE